MKKIFILIGMFFCWGGFAQPVIDDAVRMAVPEPVFEKDAGLVDLYYHAWQIASTRILHAEGMPQSPYMDEGFMDENYRDVIWIWDTCFMSLFTKYSPQAFPGLGSLKNFYVPLHDPSWMQRPASQRQLVIWHPDNPPLFSWVEYDNYRVSGDAKHIKKLLLEEKFLQKHYNWFKDVRTGWIYKGGHKWSVPVAKRSHPLGFSWSGISSGMDNTPRGRGVGYKGILWIDAISQQALSALYLSRMLESVGAVGESAQWTAEYERLKGIVNKYYWNEDDGFYYDIKRVGYRHVKVMTPASYWPLLAEIADEEQARRAIEKLSDSAKLGGFVPTPTVARDDEAFKDGGDYWKGSVWLPTSYMTIKAIEKYGYYDLAAELSMQLVEHMFKTWENYKPQTIWENYSPTDYAPGSTSRPDFCGWSALGPISLFIENIIGIRNIDALKKEIHWDLRYDSATGLKGLTFAGITTSLVAKDKVVEVISTGEYNLYINGMFFQVVAGKNSISLK
ncbi:MAG: hypothetical protein JXR63_03675 [Spirochaetales bacterium]|nr:hypothetical protein [Spirochaetales bacterium]